MIAEIECRLLCPGSVFDDASDASRNAVRANCNKVMPEIKRAIRVVVRDKNDATGRGK